MVVVVGAVVVVVAVAVVVAVVVDLIALGPYYAARMMMVVVPESSFHFGPNPHWVNSLRMDWGWGGDGGCCWGPKLVSHPSH